MNAPHFASPRQHWIALALIAVCECALAAGWTTPTARAGEETPAWALDEVGTQGAVGEDGEKRAALWKAFATDLEALRARDRIPGVAAAVVMGEEVVYQGGFGVREAGGNDEVTPETVFQIGSTSKAFTSALLAMLVQEGKLAWTDPVTRHAPDFRMHDPAVTAQMQIRDLCAQRSGMPAQALSLPPFFGVDREGIVRAIETVPPTHAFRADFTYVNSLFVVAGRIVERHDERSLEESLRARIFKPLGMKSASTDAEAFWSAPNRAAPHSLWSDKPAILTPDWKGFGWVYTYLAAGGINASVVDMGAWLRLQLGRGRIGETELIEPEQIAMLRRPSIAVMQYDGMVMSYCQAWMHTETRLGPVIWHNGGTSGSHTFVAFMPQRRVGVVIAGNLMPSPSLEPVGWRLLAASQGTDLEGMFGPGGSPLGGGEGAAEEPLARPDPALPPAPRERYVGRYANPQFGPAEVKTGADGGLTLIVGPNRSAMALRPWNGDTFLLYYFPLAEESDREFITFVPGPDGMATCFFGDVFATGGQGTFLRAPAETASENDR